MTPALTGFVGFAVAGALSCALTPLAIRVAARTGFLDRPREYRQHGSPTPFLGGAAVVLGLLVAAAVVGAFAGKLLVVLVCAAGMWLLGTLDDGFSVAPKWRLLAGTLAAVALYAVGLGWDPSGGTATGVALTIFWVVGLINAFNLMDNLDGACATVTLVAAAGIGVLAAIEGEPALAGLAFALAGACAGFLPWNLAGPARIFLGDGGSMPLGFVVSALAMAASRHAPAGNAGLLVGALLVGLPIFDVTLVSVSRTRRGVSLMTGGRDHLTHRILRPLRTPRRVAGALVLLQATFTACAIGGYELGSGAVIAIALAVILASLAALSVLDGARWRPAGIAARLDPVVAEPVLPVLAAEPVLPGLGADVA